MQQLQAARWDDPQAIELIRCYGDFKPGALTGRTCKIAALS